jgi:hypothetical protein
MDWDTLNNFIPWITFAPGRPYGSIQKVIGTGNTWGVEIGQPGHHWNQTYKPGGDFVIRVTSMAANWPRHPFTHVDLIEDLDAKTRRDGAYMKDVFLPALIQTVANGEDPVALFPSIHSVTVLPGLEPEVLLLASQCLAICEFRRFWWKEPTGGRCLPARFAVGIVSGCWSATRVVAVHRSGWSGLWSLRDNLGHEPSFQDVLRPHGLKLTSRECNEPVPRSRQFNFGSRSVPPAAR